MKKKIPWNKKMTWPYRLTATPQPQETWRRNEHRDGRKKLPSLKDEDENHVTRQCAEMGWGEWEPSTSTRFQETVEA